MRTKQDPENPQKKEDELFAGSPEQDDRGDFLGALCHILVVGGIAIFASFEVADDWRQMHESKFSTTLFLIMKVFDISTVALKWYFGLAQYNPGIDVDIGEHFAGVSKYFAILSSDVLAVVARHFRTRRDVGYSVHLSYRIANLIVGYLSLSLSFTALAVAIWSLSRKIQKDKKRPADKKIQEDMEIQEGMEIQKETTIDRDGGKTPQEGSQN